MRILTSLVAVASLLSAPCAHAAKDPGLTLHDIRGEVRQLGVGVQLSIALPLRGKSSRDAAVPRLDFRAGPSVTHFGPNVSPRSRTTVAPLAAATLRPGYSTNVSLAGQPFMTSYSAQALREQQDRSPEGERSNISTVGIVAIGVGVAAIIGGLLFIDALNDASD